MDEKTLAAYCAIVVSISAHSRCKSAQHDDAHFRKYYTHLGADQIVYSNDFMSIFEAASDTLAKMRITKVLDRCCSAYICEPHQERELVQINWPKGPSFSNLLETFVALFAEFGTENWGFGVSSVAPFRPKRPALAAAINALMPLGYISMMEDGFVWTNRARAAMVATGLWSDEEPG